MDDFFDDLLNKSIDWHEEYEGDLFPPKGLSRSEVDDFIWNRRNQNRDRLKSRFSLDELQDAVKYLASRAIDFSEPYPYRDDEFSAPDLLKDKYGISIRKAVDMWDAIVINSSELGIFLME